MKPKEAYEAYKNFKVPSLSEIRDIASEHSKTSLFIIILLVAILLLALQYVPHIQVAQFNITNQKDLADAENSYRATLAQILGGIAIAIGIYYTWRRINIAENNLKVSQDGQITERFTRAIDQLGNEKIEIRLGGIYALERIANESEKDYWPIMEILTAYVRKNSPNEHKVKRDSLASESISMDIQANESTISRDSTIRNISLDIQAILTVIGKLNHYLTEGEPHLNLYLTNLKGAYLEDAHLKRASFYGANLNGALLRGANLEGADLRDSNLEGALLEGTFLESAFLMNAHLEGAYLMNAHLRGANLEGANFEYAYLEKANLEYAYLLNTNFEGAYLGYANLKGAKFLKIDQISKARTLYKAQLDPELEKPLKEKYPDLFKEGYVIGMMHIY